MKHHSLAGFAAAATACCLAIAPGVGAEGVATNARAISKILLARAESAAPSRRSLPPYVSLHELNLLRQARGEMFTPGPRLIDPLEPVMPELLGSGELARDQGQISPLRFARLPRARRRSHGSHRRPRSGSLRPVMPLPLAPARIRRRPPMVVPQWVRYPLESQLCGIALGTRAVDKDRFNRIDRYGLFAMHGNPTAVVVPVVSGGGGGGAGGAAGASGAAAAAAPPARGAAGAGAAGAATASTVTNFNVNQTPPLAATIFPSSQAGELPDWAAAITVTLDNNSVEWLYNRGSYAMGFVVDRLGYVNAIVVAGIESPIARTQLEDPVHTVKLGDDLRKVLFRYGYPDTVETYPVNVTAGVSVGTNGGGGQAGAGAGAGAPAAAAGGAGGAGAAAQAGNGAFQTFEVRYEQSYNVVFTIRYNRVVRMYIFGDPDFFNLQRRNSIRKQF